MVEEICFFDDAMLDKILVVVWSLGENVCILAVLSSSCEQLPLLLDRA